VTLIVIIGLLVLVAIGGIAVWWLMGQPLYQPGMVRSGKNLRGPLVPPEQTSKGSYWLHERTVGPVGVIALVACWKQASASGDGAWRGLVLHGPRFAGEVGGRDHVDARKRQEQHVGGGCQQMGTIALQCLNFQALSLAIVFVSQGDAAVHVRSQVGWGRGLGPLQDRDQATPMAANALLMRETRQTVDARFNHRRSRAEVPHHRKARLLPQRFAKQVAWPGSAASRSSRIWQHRAEHFCTRLRRSRISNCKRRHDSSNLASTREKPLAAARRIAARSVSSVLLLGSDGCRNCLVA